ncbi:hypothetical protein C7999DRAFT_30116 [Corynascus novoguineensis]|uniref:Uncharacterized protein n=1 Tax=Corynascus novoguineensis TaxID=1126955 RepID=A0AAN7CY26_9PEZI|nr:hypothetical protein C7999DRAFT_30116 [Corynascus novoguineensis]
MSRSRLSGAVLALAIAPVRAAIDYMYVTDMAAYSALDAIRYNVQGMTYDACPEAVSELQSCVCTKNNNFAFVSSEISSSVSYYCGSTASEDRISAQIVFSAYCNPDETVSFVSPTAVSAYITDIPEFEYLAPCAQSVLKYAVGTMSWSRCPTDAPALASCACKKNQNSLVVSQLINSAKSSCSGHTADVSSAHAMFAAYCAMNDGTTKFPQPSDPPGDMTYYITDLPDFSSLAPCAASGLSYAVASQTYYLCPDGPQALASCVCLKAGMTNHVLKVITSSVKWRCDSTASEDVSSAVSIFDYYCSAAEAKVTPAGISVSVEQSRPGQTGNGPQQTGSGGSGSGNGNGSGDSSGNDNGSDGSSQSGDGSGSSSSPGAAVIGGAVTGVVVALAIIGAIVFFILRKVRRNGAGSMQMLSNAPPATGPPVHLGQYGGKPELPSDSFAGPLPPPSPSQSTFKAASPARVDNVSPISASAGAPTPPSNNRTELSGQTAPFPPVPNRPELHSQPTSTASPQPSSRPELHGQGQGQSQGQNAMFAAPPPNAPELYGQGAPLTVRPELQGQGAMHPTPPNAPELYGQGAPLANRPELQGQGAMYATAPPNMSELQGQGTQFHNANPNRPELAGQHNYPPQQSPYIQHHQQQQQQQQQQHQHPQQQYPSPTQSPHPQQMQPRYQVYNTGTPPPPPPGMYGQQHQPPHPQASWQAGPVPEFHEMDGA